jgi:transposase-like protein
VTERAAPFYCPYCGDEDLRPFDPDDGGAGHGQWRCRACQRVFALKYIGLTGGWSSSEPRASAESTEPLAVGKGATT